MTQPAATAPASLAERPSLAAAARAVLAEMGRDRWLYAAVGAYLAAACAVTMALGRSQFFLPFIYLPVWLRGMVAYLGLYLLISETPGAMRDNPRAPLGALAARIRARATPRALAGLVLFAAVGVFSGVFTCMKSLINDVAVFSWDVTVANWDAAVHGGTDPWKLIQPLLGHHWITRGVQHLYLGGWTFFLLTFSLYMALSPKMAHLRARFFAAYFAAWILLGNVMAAAFMSGGPVYYAALTGDHARFAGLMDYLSFSEGMTNSSIAVQDLLWSLRGEEGVQIGAGISAFPSLHVAMATLFALTAFKIGKRLGWAMTAFAVLIQLGSVHLGWHYAVDGYVSALLVAAMWFGLGAVLKPKPAT